MEKNKNEKTGDEAPSGRDILVVIAAVALLIIFSWIAWYKLGWFH